MYQGKCILAVGGANASMRYLKDNDAAIVINDITKVDSIIKSILDTPELIEQYAQKSWECGVRNHNINEIQKMLYSDFLKVLEA